MAARSAGSLLAGMAQAEQELGVTSRLILCFLRHLAEDAGKSTSEIEAMARGFRAGGHEIADSAETADMAVVNTCAVTAEAVPLLRDVNGNAVRLHQLTGRLVSLEGEADDIHAEGLKTAFQKAKDDPLQFAVTREVFKNLERVTDAFEDVANAIDGLVIDHA